jgi:signal transduction histidine kinase
VVRRVYATGVVVVAMVVAFLGWAYVLVARDASRRRRTAETLRRANEELEARVKDRTAALADANAQLSESLGAAQRARRETEAASRLKDEFLMTVSHELRTPLTAIRGWARMLSTGEIREEQKRHALETIERNARAQTQLVDDLLDVSRAISGKLRLDVAIVDLPAVVDAAVESIRPAAAAKEIRLQTIVDPSAGPVSGDAARLQQVVWNLVTNAVKFTPKHGRVQVRVERVNSHVEIVVSDTGAGISAEFLPHVFERFRQEDAGTTRSHGGLGLGLAIVRHLIELHGGTVAAESGGAGMGATFRVLLPLTIGRKTAERVSPVLAAAEPRSGLAR